MKKIIYSLFIMSFALFSVACSDDDKDTEFSVTETMVVFDANASEGFIAFAASGDVVVKSDQEWCKAVVNGSRVTITVTENDELLGRTALVTLNSGGILIPVPVTQAGSLLTLDKDELSFVMSDAPTQEIELLKALVGVEVSSIVSWIKAKIEGKKIIVEVEDTGIPREGVLTIVSGIKTELVTVKQIIPTYKTILGQWKLTCVNSSNVNEVKVVEFVEKEDGVSYTLKGMSSGGMEYAVKYVHGSGDISIPSMQNVGIFGPYTCYNYILGIQGQSLKITTAAHNFNAAYKSSAGSALQYEFYDDGLWAGIKKVGFAVYAYDKPIEDGGVSQGSLERYTLISMEKMP